MASSQDLPVASAFGGGRSMSKNLRKIRKEMLQNNNRTRVSFLEKGKNVLVNNSDMTAIGEVKHVRNYYIDNTAPANAGTSDHGLYLLSKAIAHGAMHDSSERFPPPRCDLTENQPVIGAISAWATDLTASASVLWVTSPPGTDKSLLTGIGQTVAEQLVEEGRLGGCFFFDSHVLKRDRETALFSTLAYQIATNKPEMRGHISSAMHVDPTFPTKSITIQLRDLIIRPFRRMMFSSVINPQVSTIIIDALEDCSTPTVQLEILRLILAEVEQKTPIPLRFLILSEPKAYIRDLLEDYAAAKLVLRIDLDIKENVDPQSQRPQSPERDLMCRSMPSATPEVMSLLESHFSRRPSPPKPMRPEARIRIKGFSPLDIVMNSSKGSSPASSRMQVSGASLTRTDPNRTLSSSTSSPMSVDPISHFSSLRSAMSVDPKSMPRSRGGSHHSLAAWTTRMEITQEPLDNGRQATRATRAAKKPELSFHDDDDGVQDRWDWGDGPSGPVPIPLTRRKSPSGPYGRVTSSLPGKSWHLVESGADGSNGYWASEVTNLQFRCRSCSSTHGPLDVSCPQAASLARRPDS